MAGKSPTSRTNEWLRAQGFVVDGVEQRQPWTAESGYSPLRDFCNFADLIAFDPDVTVAVQCTSTSNLGSRAQKCLAEPRAYLWVHTHVRQLWVIGWRKYAKPLPGKRTLWRPTLQVVTGDQFPTDVVAAAEELILDQRLRGKKLLDALGLVG